MKNIVKFLFIFVFIFSFFGISNAIGNLPKASNSSASDVASPNTVREALNIKYPNLKDKYCDDYRKSGDGVTVWCSGNYHLSKTDLQKATNPNSSWGPYLPKNLNNLNFTPTLVRDCIKKKYNFDVTYAYSDYRKSGDGIALWTEGKPCLKLSADELKNCNNTIAKCGVDFYKSSNSCIAVGIGFYSPKDNDNRYSCTNKPANSKYTSDGNGANNCSWTCNSGYQKSGNSCILIPVNQAPTANAGPDKTINEGESVVLHGTGTDNDGTIVKYEWFDENGNKKHDGADYTINNLDIGTHRFKLTVTDDDGDSSTDSVEVTVNINQAPKISNYSGTLKGDSISVYNGVILNAVIQDEKISTVSWTLRVIGAENKIIQSGVGQFPSSGIEYKPTREGIDGDIDIYLDVTDENGKTTSQKIFSGEVVD